MPARSCSTRLRKPTRRWQTCAVGRILLSLAAEYDPVAEGELGWFPRGYLFDKELEDAAFGLQAGEYSQVIETPRVFTSCR